MAYAHIYNDPTCPHCSIDRREAFAALVELDKARVALARLKPLANVVAEQSMAIARATIAVEILKAQKRYAHAIEQDGR